MESRDCKTVRGIIPGFCPFLNLGYGERGFHHPFGAYTNVQSGSSSLFLLSRQALLFAFLEILEPPNADGPAGAGIDSSILLMGDPPFVLCLEANEWQWGGGGGV